MSDERVRDGKHRHLVHGLVDLYVIREPFIMLRIGPHGDDDLPVRLPQHIDAVPVEFPVLIDRSHGNIDQLVRRLFHGVSDRPDRRSDEMVPVRKSFRTRLEVLRCVDDRICIIVILHYIEQALHGISFVAKAL